jgi:hypothetical protein
MYNRWCGDDYTLYGRASNSYVNNYNKILPTKYLAYLRRLQSWWKDDKGNNKITDFAENHYNHYQL